MSHTVGSYLATRLAQIGLKHHFMVTGDYNLVLLDQLLSNPGYAANWLLQRAQRFICRRGLCSRQWCGSLYRHFQRGGALRI